MTEEVPTVVVVENKEWWKSRTLYANVVMAIGLAITQFTDLTMNAEESGAVIIVVNLVMRVITKTGLTK